MILITLAATAITLAKIKLVEAIEVNFFYGLLPYKIILSSAQMKIYFSSNFFYGLLPPKIILSSAQMKIHFSSDFFNSYEKKYIALADFLQYYTRISNPPGHPRPHGSNF